MFGTFAVQGITCMHVFQLDGTANITCHHFFHLNAVSTCTGIYLGNAFFRATVGIRKVVAFVHLSAHHLKILYITDMRLYGCLEEVKRSRSVGIRVYYLTAGVMHRRHLVHERNDVAQELHQTAHTHILACAYAEHGEHAAWSQSFANTLAHLVFRQGVLLEELLHQGFVVFGSSFHQCFMQLGGFLHLLCGNIFDSGCTAFGSPRIFFHQKYINQRIEVRSGSQRVLHGYYLRTVCGLQLLQYHVVITLFVVKLIHKEDDRFAQLLCIPEVVLSANFRTVLSVQK